jgi:hypothetical protein
MWISLGVVMFCKMLFILKNLSGETGGTGFQAGSCHCINQIYHWVHSHVHWLYAAV